MKKPPLYQVSAGGVLIRRGPKGPEVCLIHPKGTPPGRWQLPKGHVDPGEVCADTAVREVYEETGCKGALADKLGSIEYWFWHRKKEQRERIRIHKRVTFFLMHFEEGDLSQADPDEIEKAKFFPVRQALRLTTFKAERKLIHRAMRYLEEEERQRQESS